MGGYEDCHDYWWYIPVNEQVLPTLVVHQCLTEMLTRLVSIYVACRTTNDVAQAKAVALAVGVPVGMLGIQLDVFAKLLNTYVTHAAQKACNEKKFSKMNRILWIGPMVFALSTGLPTALCVVFGDAIVNVILNQFQYGSQMVYLSQEICYQL